MKALDKDGGCFQYICNKFPGLSYEKAKAGIFYGPQIRTLIKDINFIPSMNEMETSAWSSFVGIVRNFLVDHRAENVEELVDGMLSTFKNLGAHEYQGTLVTQPFKSFS